MRLVTVPKKGWKRPFEKEDDDGIKRDESCDKNKT